MGNIHAITVPKWGMEMEEGTISEWRLEEGSLIEVGDELVDIETSKIVNTLEARHPGILRRRIAEVGVTLPVGALLGVCAEEGVPEPEIENFIRNYSGQLELVNGIVPERIHVAEVSNSSNNSQFRASPSARKLAQQLGVDISRIVPTGARGRVSKEDVERAFKSGETRPQDVVNSPQVNDTGNISGNSFQDIPLSNMRKTIANRLVKSKQQIPHFYLTVECEIDELLRIRQRLNEQLDVAEKVSVSDFVTLAAARALEQHKAVNSQFNNGFIREFEAVNIALAVATDAGLVTPVLRGVGSMSLKGVAVASRDMAQRAHAGKLSLGDLEGGTFCISNLGMFGVRQFDAVINPPHAAILAVGAGERRPVVRGDDVAVATVMAVTLSCDHRVVDGAVGALWLGSFQRFLEEPALML